MAMDDDGGDHARDAVDHGPEQHIEVVNRPSRQTQPHAGQNAADDEVRDEGDEDEEAEPDQHFCEWEGLQAIAHGAEVKHGRNLGSRGHGRGGG